MAKNNSKAKTMHRKTKNEWLIKLALKFAGGKMWKDLDKKSKNIKKVEKEVLMDIINYGKNTEYGKEHGFDKIKTIEDFQKQVPINHYEDLKPYIERQSKGQADVIVPGKPKYYATTSGTTKEPKLIPITEKYYKECYNALSKLWFYSVLKEHPTVFHGPELSIVGRSVEGHTEDGTPIGSISGNVYENIPEFLKTVHVMPSAVYQMKDYSSRYYCIMRISIEYSIRLVITGNPSTLLEMNRVTNERIDDIIEDIEKGTLNQNLEIDDKYRKEIEDVLEPNPERAKDLRQIKEKYETIYPKHYWPELQVINTWRCANSGLYLKHTENFYPEETKVREFGFIATEARAGIILKSDQIPSIMASHLLFFEFIKEEDIDKDNPKVYLASELEDGKRYYLIVTTPSGLYRYNMNDILVVEGFYNEFPKMRFIQKGAGITSLTGEKLHETQFLEAVESVRSELSIPTAFHIAFADFDSSRYHAYIEFAKDSVSDAEVKNFEQALDNKLREVNIEYESKRDSNRIKPIVIHKLKSYAFDSYKSMCMAKGQRDGQFKLTHLMIDSARKEMFDELVIK